MKAAYLNQGREAGVARVYDTATAEAIDALFDLAPVVYTKEDVLADRLTDVEALFSTWGFPVMTDEEIATHLPKLKVVFYGAGSVQAFARPLIRNGGTVVSAWMATASPSLSTPWPRSFWPIRATSVPPASAPALPPTEGRPPPISIPSEATTIPP